MEIVKLGSEHEQSIYDIFGKRKFMGVESEKFVEESEKFKKLYHEMFSNTYLTGLKSYHAYGAFEEGKIQGIISFYESIDEPSWYGTGIRSLGNKKCKVIL